MNPELQIIVAPSIVLSPVTISTDAIALKDAALESCALIGKVTNAEENEAASRAQSKLKAVYSTLEKARVKMKEPFLEMGRAIDRAVTPQKEEIDLEDGRISALISDFKLAERRRIAEEEELQRRELARIEKEKQAELNRIAAEAKAVADAVAAAQAEIDRKARETREAADRLVAEATNNKQHEAAAAAQAAASAQAALAETQRLENERVVAESNRVASQSVEAVETKANQAAYFESRPVVGTKAKGQSEKDDWEIQVTNPYELAKFAPDCVTITPLVGKIKAALTEGRTLKGVTAKKILVTNQRAARNPTIDI